jgi:hypothetical protein
VRGSWLEPLKRAELFRAGRAGPHVSASYRESHNAEKESVCGGDAHRLCDRCAERSDGNLVAPLINKKAIQAEYLSANARQLQTVYNYQRVVLNAFTEVINRMSMVQNYSSSIEIKKQQLKALELSVDAATNLFQNARAEYIEVLFAQRDLMEARMVVIQTKKEQLSAVVNAYQALGGGNLLAGSTPEPPQLHRWNPLRRLIEHCLHTEDEHPQEVMDEGHPPTPGTPVVH